MGTDNWDAALVMRANELLVEIRRYHVDAEATRLQLASAAASMTRKLDELPATVRLVVEDALLQDASIAERPVLVQRLDRSSRMLDELAKQFNNSGLLFLSQSRRISMALTFTAIVVGISAAFWTTVNGARTLKLTTEILELQRTIDQLQGAGNQTPIKTCFDSLSRPRLCVRIDEDAGKPKDSYYFVRR